MKKARRIFLIIISIFFLWVIGIFAQLPLMPFIETNYFIKEKDLNLSKGVTIEQSKKTTIKIEIPNYFPEGNQCFDIWFSSTNGEHNLSVTKFSFKISTIDNIELERESLYLFSDKRSKDETSTIENYSIEKHEIEEDNNYVFFRTVYNVETINNLNIFVLADYSIDNETYSMNKKIEIIKKRRLTWNKLKAH
jgi:hypothetical protein